MKLIKKTNLNNKIKFNNKYLTYFKNGTGIFPRVTVTLIKQHQGQMRLGAKRQHFEKFVFILNYNDVQDLNKGVKFKKLE